MDLQKAFDTVDHDILSHKMHCYGVRRTVHDWFRSYLYHRKQSTSLAGYTFPLSNINKFPASKNEDITIS